jgi:heptosyltransferase-2
MHKRTPVEVRALIAGGQTASCQSIPATAHQLHEYLHLAAALGANPAPLAPLLAVTEAEVAAARAKFGVASDRPLFGLNPGAEYGPAKRWPAEKFIAAAMEIQRQTNCVWLLFGGKNDDALSQQIFSALNHSSFTIHNFCGKTSLRELMSLLKLCRVVLTNDTGPMHVAAALGTRVVVPFGSTSPELTGPGALGDAQHRLIKSDAACSPCFLRECPVDFRCMNGIAVEQMVAAVLACV